ncbi:DUF378 domain-containing protein [bacterium]|nr:DUF378 domain-containing protein [bacterium]
MKTLHMISFILLLIGGLNWLLLGLFNWEVGALFGGQSAIISKIIYILVGLAAIFEIATHKGTCKCCTGGECGAMKKEMPKTGGNMNKGM